MIFSMSISNIVIRWLLARYRRAVFCTIVIKMSCVPYAIWSFASRLLSDHAVRSCMVVCTTLAMVICTIVVKWSFVPRLLWSVEPSFVNGHLYHGCYGHLERVTDRHTDTQTDRQTDTGEFRFLDPILSV